MEQNLGYRYANINSPAIVWIDDKLIGTDDDFYKWSKDEFKMTDYRPVPLYETFTKRAYYEFLARKNVCSKTWLLISIDQRTYITMTISIGSKVLDPLLLEVGQPFVMHVISCLAFY